MSDPANAAKAPAEAPADTPEVKRTTRFRRSNAPRLDPACARRQGDITRTAFLLLGRESAMAFLNEDNADLGGRPLDLATASDEGRDRVEAALGQMAEGSARTG